jgi:hypothetical protein
VSKPGIATLADQIAEVQREIGYRQRVYPRMVAQEKMTQDEAEVHMHRMLAVLLTLEKLRDDGVEAALDMLRGRR